MQVNNDLAADPIDIVATFAAQRPRHRRGCARVRLLAVSLSVLMSPFWQKAHRMLQEVKKIVPEPCVPR